MTLRRYIILAVVTLTSALGDTFLDVGMKQLGPVSLHHLSTLLVALKLPWVLAGIVLLIGFFVSYLTALSWADVTFVLPATSFAYVVVALLSRFWLHEQITPARWLGIFCIVAGVGFVTRGPAYTEQPSPGPAEAAASPVSMAQPSVPQPSVSMTGTVAQHGVKQ
jgi:drug/metabolite transporter (DMT)-like permease